MFIAFSSIIEGTAEKVLQFMMPLKSIYNQNLGFIEQRNVLTLLWPWKYFLMPFTELPPIGLS